MEKMEKDELYNMEGGTSVSGTLINAFTNVIEFLFNMGQHLGSAIRRISSDKMCQIP